MRLTDILQPKHIVVPLHADTVRTALQALLRRLVETGALERSGQLEKLTAEERIRDVIHAGERVLLPHLRTDAAHELVVALGIAGQPLRGASAGTQGTEQVVVLVVAPPHASNQYLQLVAALARVLRSEGVVDRLLQARSPEEVLEIGELRDLALQPRLTVRDIMSVRPFRVFPDTPVQELVELMARHGLSAVPVVNDKREVLGMVTERDLLRHLHPRISRTGAPRLDGGGESAGEGQSTPARDIMSRSVMCISEDQAVSDVVSIMLNKDVQRFPVVGEGKLTGFLTRGDIIRKLFGA
jgi:CBS domain-containing protein/mannitol/fructose-specific phosphotransferase system IIA component (Ntr-type)